MIEHRYGRRYPLPQPIPVSLFHGGQYASNGRIRNVSLHGVFIETHAYFDYNTSLKIRFTLSDERGKSVSYQTWGVVTHNQNNGLGLQMDILHPDTLAGLKAISEQAPEVQEGAGGA
jgi:hypothetical protein